MRIVLKSDIMSNDFQLRNFEKFKFINCDIISIHTVKNLIYVIRISNSSLKFLCQFNTK